MTHASLFASFVGNVSIPPRLYPCSLFFSIPASLIYLEISFALLIASSLLSAVFPVLLSAAPYILTVRFSLAFNNEIMSLM